MRLKVCMMMAIVVMLMMMMMTMAVKVIQSRVLQGLKPEVKLENLRELMGRRAPCVLSCGGSI